MKNVVKDINENFVSNNLNNKKSGHLFVKKLVFGGQFYQEVGINFLMKPSDTSMINPVFHNKN